MGKRCISCFARTKVREGVQVMTALLIAVSLMGGCRRRVIVQQVIVQKKVVQQVVQQVVQTPVQQFTQFVAPVAASYRVGYDNKSEERIRLLEDAVLKLTQIAQTAELRAGVNQVQVDPVESKARAVLRRSCTSCHSGQKPKKGLDLTGELDGMTMTLAAGEAELGKMPPKPHPVITSDSYKALRAWANQLTRSELKNKLEAKERSVKEEIKEEEMD